MRRIAKNPEVVIVQNPAVSFPTSKGKVPMRRKHRKHRKNAYNARRKSHRKHHVRRNKGRGRKVSAYARFVGAKMRAGHSMKAAARMWKSK